MSSFQIPVEIIWSLIGALLMIINSLFWQKLNSLEKLHKILEGKIYQLEYSNIKKLDEIKLEIKDSILNLTKIFYELEIKFMKDYVSKNECKQKENLNI